MTGGEYIEQAVISLAMFLDEVGFSYDDGIDFTENLSDELESVAADRSDAEAGGET